MPSKYWIKLSHKILDDPKIGRLPSHLWRLYIELLLIASENDHGALKGTYQIADRLWRLPEGLEPWMECLAQEKLIEGDHCNWKLVDHWQYCLLSSRPNLRGEWRDAILERDNWLCQDCGLPLGEVELEAHHIKPWFLNRRERFNISNGITLCKDCHRKRHRSGWKRRALATGRT